MFNIFWKITAVKSVTLTYKLAYLGVFKQIWPRSKKKNMVKKFEHGKKNLNMVKKDLD